MHLTARSGIQLVKALRELMRLTKQTLRDKLPKLYNKDLLNHLFRLPYTKIEFLEKEPGVSRITAARHLKPLAEAGLVEKSGSAKPTFTSTARCLFC